MYLLDTDVISALRRPAQNLPVAEWMNSVSRADIFLSVPTIMEIERGAARQRKENPRFAMELAHWLDTIIVEFGARVLPITVAVARRWGALSAAIGHDNRDLAIAATALEHGLTVATRNVRDFLPTGARVFDPFARKLHAPR